MDRVVFGGVASDAISPLIKNRNVELVAGGVLVAEDLDWEAEVVVLGIA